MILLLPKLSDGENKLFFKTGGEWCYIWTPPKFKKQGKIPVIIHHHGARGYVREGEADWLDDPLKKSYLKAVMDGVGCAIVGSHAGGDHWGNQKSVESNYALFKALIESPSIDPGRVGLIGGGSRRALVWNSIAGPMANRIKAVAVIQAVSSLEAIIREQKFRKALLDAFGLPEETSDEDAIKTIKPYDPLPKLQRLKKGSKLPKTAIFHGAEDENIPARTHAIPLAEALRKAAGDVTLEVFPGVGHAVYAMGEPIKKRLRDFFASSL
ncbi:prolyl oligopeptidase family serine peptidase [Candidatus Bathyarchaeota archaeon]|nr:prolyl oligopeptidase family serine peptidase [Candidatus Bathyarchaeota archaeon]